MILQLWYDSTQQPFETDPANEGWNDAKALWGSLRQSGNVQCEEVDTAWFSDEQRREGYWKAVAPTHRYAWRGYAVSQVFGTKRKRAGPHFGRGVPALLVYEEGGEHPVDTYPHRERNELFTIHSCLSQLAAELGRES